MNDTPRSVRTGAFDELATWAQQDPAERDDTLLLQASPAAWIGGIHSVTLQPRKDDGSPLFRLVLSKPGGQGETTHRDLDPEGLALFMGLCLAGGGRLAIEGKGLSGDYYYVRLYLTGLQADGRQRRVHAMPVIADTPAGMHTVEPADYHSLQRRDLAVRERTGKERAAKYGTEEAKGYAKDRWSELARIAPDTLPETRSERAQGGEAPTLYVGFLGALRRIRTLFSAATGTTFQGHKAGAMSCEVFHEVVGAMEYDALLEALHARLKALPLRQPAEA